MLSVSTRMCAQCFMFPWMVVWGDTQEKNPVSSSALKMRRRHQKKETGNGKKSEKGIPESGGICRWRARELRSASTACPHAQRHASSPCRCRPNSAVACGPRSGRRGVFKNRRRRRRADLQYADAALSGQDGARPPAARVDAAAHRGRGQTRSRCPFVLVEF